MHFATGFTFTETDAVLQAVFSVGEELGIRAKLLAEGGPKMWADFMDELRETHLGVKRRKKAGSTVAERLRKAYEEVVANKAASVIFSIGASKRSSVTPSFP
jgi:hypothetical protein